MIWSNDAIDYSAGVDITDLVTGKVYSHEEALALDKNILEEALIRCRLVNKPRKIGCMVYTIDEINDIMKYRRLNNYEVRK